MVQKFDLFERQEKPELTLTNPNGDALYSLKMATGVVATQRYNATSEISFSFPKEYNGVVLPAYDAIKQKRRVSVDDTDVGVFIIVDVSEDTSHLVPIKTVRCLSLEFSLMAKKLTVFGGTYPLYDILEPETSLLGTVLSYIPSWSIGTVDPDLLAKYRTFDVSDTNIYNFLMTDVEEAFGCIFTFDTINKTISAVAIENVTNQTDVYISHRNLIESSSLREISDEITTALYVYGGGDLDIRTVNPLGTNIIYNFDYYKTTEWMSQGLIDALDLWESSVLAQQGVYASTLSDLKDSLSEKVVLEGELVDLNSEYLAIESVQRARIESGLAFADINILLAAKQVEMDDKQTEIDNIGLSIDFLRASLTLINDGLSFENNFTEAQILELSYFMFENTYKNENLVQLDSDDPDTVQELAQVLYDQSVTILERISQPRYEFSMDMVSMLALKEYDVFTAQLSLGSSVYVEQENGSILNIVLLEMVFDYDNPEDFSMVFSNRLRLDNGEFVYSDLFGQPVKVGTTVKFDKVKWANWASDYKDSVTGFISSSLDASLNNIINASDEEIKIYENGLRGKHWDSGTGTYDPREIWMTSNMIAFTNDGWDTAAMAVGEIDFNGVPLYGIVADAIVGRLIAGNSLSIENETNNFLLDSTGAWLNNATFTLTANGGKNSIILNPSTGIEIWSDMLGTPKKSFYADSAGNIIFTGDLSGATGTFSGAITATSGSIGGMTITSNGIDVDATHFIHNNGDITWGGLIISGATASFSGTISASKLSGTVDWSQIVNVPIPTSKFNGGTGYSAAGITTGTLSGSRVYGGTIGWDGVQLYTSSFGQSFLTASNAFKMQSPQIWMQATTAYATGNLNVWGNMVSDTVYSYGTCTASGRSYMNGGITVSGNSGLSTAYSIFTSSGYRTFTWRYGVLISVA